MSTDAEIRQKLRPLMNAALTSSHRSGGIDAVKKILNTAIASEQFTVTSCRMVGAGQYQVSVTGSDGNRLAVTIP